MEMEDYMAEVIVLKLPCVLLSALKSYRFDSICIGLVARVVYPILTRKPCHCKSLKKEGYAALIVHGICDNH